MGDNKTESTVVLTHGTDGTYLGMSVFHNGKVYNLSDELVKIICEAENKRTNLDK